MDRRIASLTLALLLTTGATSAQQAERKLQRGIPLKISGRVLDTSRTALGGVTVLFETSRRPSGLFKKRKQETVDKVSLPTQADGDGAFTFDWPWDPYYDSFALAVALPIHQGDFHTFEILHHTDISAALLQGNLGEIELVVEESAGLVWLRRFLGEEASEDERRIFHELGRPDRYDAPKKKGGEAAWWYFTAGKVYWFKEGRLDQVVHFESIPPIE